MSGLDLSDLSVKNNPPPQVAPRPNAIAAAPDTAEEDVDDTPQLTPEQRISRHKVYLLVQEYMHSFPTKLEKFKLEPIDDLDEEELKELLEEMKMTLRSTNTIDLWSAMFFCGLGTAEQIIPTFTPLKLSGMTELAKLDESLNDAVREMALEQGGLQFLSPTYRIMLGLGKVAFQAHTINSMQQEMQKPIKSEMAEKYGDL